MYTFEFPFLGFQYTLRISFVQFSIAQLLQNPKIKRIKIKIRNVFTKEFLGTTSVEIKCNLVIIWHKVTLLYFNMPILIPEKKIKQAGAELCHA